MARNLFGGSAADVAEDIDGSRVPSAEGTVWNGPGTEASQITDLTTYSGSPTNSLTANAEGMVEHFYGPDGVTLLYVDFGAGRVALTPVNTSTDLANHLNADDPHGSRANAIAEMNAQKGTPGGIATLDTFGRVTPSQLPPLGGGGGGGTALDWHNVKSATYGAVGDGLADDTAAIQAAIDAAGYGGVVYFPQGVYQVSQPLDLPRGVVLQGTHSNLMVGPGMVASEWACYIQAAETFTAGSMITIVGDDDGDHPAINGEQRIQNLMFDGSLVPGWGLDGIFAKGNVQNVVLRDVCIRQMPNQGIITASNTLDEWPWSWRLHSVMVDNCHTNGMVFERHTDLSLIDCQIIGCWSTGVRLTNCANSLVTHSRAEWNGNYGFHFTGGWGNWSGSGSMSMTGCSTDRNGWDGLMIDASGNGAFLIQSFMSRRDGRNGGTGGGGYAGVSVENATAPVVLSGITCYPGSDDGGGLGSSPDYGVSVSGSTSVQIGESYLHAFLSGFHNDGTNTQVVVGTGVQVASGLSDAPVRSLVPVTQNPLLESSRSVTITEPVVGEYVIWRAQKACEVTAVHGLRVGGTGATINAEAGGLDLLATSLSLATADTWLSGTGLQNVALDEGEALAVAVRSVAGATSLTIQIDFTEV